MAVDFDDEPDDWLATPLPGPHTRVELPDAYLEGFLAWCRQQGYTVEQKRGFSGAYYYIRGTPDGDCTARRSGQYWYGPGKLFRRYHESCQEGLRIKHHTNNHLQVASLPAFINWAESKDYKVSYDLEYALTDDGPLPKSWHAEKYHQRWIFGLSPNETHTTTARN